MTDGLSLSPSVPEVSSALAAPAALGPVTGDCLTLDEALREADAWRALADGALEKNPFFGPDFLKPYLKHLAPSGLRIAIARHRSDGSFRALAPVGLRRPGLGLAGRATTVWSHNFAPLGTPLAAPGDATGALAALLGAAGAAFSGRLLAIPFLRLDGPVHAALKDALGEKEWRTALADAHERAALDCRGDAESYLKRNLSGNRRRRLARMRRNIAGEGAFEAHWVTDAAAVAGAFEDYLRLEAAGWKGRDGTAIACDGARSAFAREAVAALAAAGKVGIQTLALDAKPVGITVFLLDGPQGIAWKTAYDEALGQYSPGVLSIVDAMDHVMGGPALREIDSLSDPGHPMIEPLWHERMPVATLLAAGGPLAGARLAAARADIAAHHRARAAAKAGIARLKAALRR